MDFRILGPLEVWDRGQRVELRRRKQRALLAMLLLRPGEILSKDVLIDGLWGEAAPRTAIQALRNNVSQLRSVLGSGVVSGRAGGYLLEVRPEEIDLGRFEKLMAEGRQTGGEHRVQRLREALAQWRGPPLADLAFEPFAAREVERLEGRRTAALEDLIDAELALGAGAQLVSELESLISKHPFRERLRGQLMLALYRAGRQAEALDAYQDTRRTLVDELGIEPSTPLRELEQAILRQDETLAYSAPPKTIPSLEERRKTVTVLLADLSSDIKDPELLVDAIGPALAELRDGLESHGATIEQRAGDEVMAVFGVPVSNEDDALRAARAALQVQREIGALSDVLERARRGRIDLRVGIDAGEVLAGTDVAGHGFIAGPAIGLAKRLQQAALPGEILVGEEALGLLGDTVETEPFQGARPGDRRVLGIVEGAPALARHLEVALVGREHELAALRAAFERVAGEGRCRRFTIIGEAGIGKTRLAGELISNLGEETTALVGRCTPYGKGSSYLPVAEMIREIGAGVELSVLLGDDEHAELITRKLAMLTGEEDGAGSLGEAFWAVRRLCEALAREQRLTLVFEDLHWAEPTLLDLIEHLVTRAVDSPIFILGTARPEFALERPAWIESDAVELSLLPRHASERLVDNLADLAADLRARIVRIGEGNPLFLEQLVTFAAENPTLGVVPPSLEALLASRLDRLEPGELAVLQRAAVIGREFRRGAVVELTPAGDVAAIGEQLDALARRGLIRPRVGSTYRFHHVLIRDVAYGTLPKARRAEMHECLARWLEAKSEGSDELVGFHFEQACRYLSDLSTDRERVRQLAEEAGARLGAAGMRAWRRADVAATASLLGRAAELLPRRDPGRLELLCELGLALRTAGEIPRANEVLQEASAEAAAGCERRIELRARIELANSRLSGHPEGSDELLELISTAVPTFEALGDVRSLGRAWLLFGYVQGGLRCQNVEWQEAAERALAHYRESGWPTAACFGEIATALYYGPTPVLDAIGHCERLLGEVSERGGEAHLLVWLAGLHAFRGDLDEGRNLLGQASRIYDELGYRMAIAYGCGAVLGDLELLAGDPEAAERALRASCQQLEGMHEQAVLASRAAELAEAIYLQDRLDEAERWTFVADAHAARDDVGAQLLLRAVRAKILARRDSPAQAEGVARDAVLLAERTDALNFHAKALLDQAEVLRLGGNVREARASMKSALDCLERKGNLVGADRARGLLGDAAALR